MEQIRKQTILIADDSEMNREILIDMLGEEYNILEAQNGEEAVMLLQQVGVEIDLMLLDIVMPKMDGFAVLGEMNQQQWINDIPVIIISSESKADVIERAYELGAVDFISRPFDQAIVHRRTTNTILLYAKRRKLMDMVAEQIYEKEKQSGMMIDILGHIVEFRNGESGQHVRHIHVLTELMLNELQRLTGHYPLTKTEMNVIATASALHDIGKIAIPSEILNKPGRLTDEEFRVMKTHTSIGADMLNALPIHQEEALVRTAYAICRWHHERWDGRGYPDGLKGDEIPISAQIVALADVYDALTSERVYKKAFSHETAVGMILDNQCGVFNPVLMDCLRNIAPRLPDELRRYGELGDTRSLQAISAEVQRHEELSISNRTLQMLEYERTKTRFFADMSKEIQFEYTASPSMLTLSSFGVEKLGLSETIMNPQKDERVRQIMGDEGIQGFSDALHATSLEQPVVQYESLVSIGGERRWMRIISRANWTNDVPPRYLGAIGKAVDIHDEHTRLSTLEWLSSHDSLTGLFNHASARKAIEERIALRPKARFVMLVFDIDDFKSINDQNGHLFGDHTLTHIADQARKSARSGDIIARVGGDEFLIFLEYRGDETAAVQRIWRSLCGEFEGRLITISMGAARTDAVGRDYETLFHSADQALYAAKNSGRNQVRYYQDDMRDMLSAVSEIDREQPEGRSGKGENHT